MCEWLKNINFPLSFYSTDLTLQQPPWPCSFSSRMGSGADPTSPGTLKIPPLHPRMPPLLLSQLFLPIRSFCTALNYPIKARLIDFWPSQWHLKWRDKTSIYKPLKVTFEAGRECQWKYRTSAGDVLKNDTFVLNKRRFVCTVLFSSFIWNFMVNANKD